MRKTIAGAAIAAAVCAGTATGALAATASASTARPAAVADGGHHGKLIERAHCVPVALAGSTTATVGGDKYGKHGEAETYSAQVQAWVCESAEYKDHGKITGGVITVKLGTPSAAETEAKHHGGGDGVSWG
jgi:hypothetical protein